MIIRHSYRNADAVYSIYEFVERATKNELSCISSKEFFEILKVLYGEDFSQHKAYDIASILLGEGCKFAAGDFDTEIIETILSHLPKAFLVEEEGDYIVINEIQETEYITCRKIY